MNKRRVGPSLYFASDKVIFDALNHRPVKVDVLRDLLFDRGIIVSQKTSKFALAHYISRLSADYFDQRSIGLKLGRIAKRDRMTFVEYKGGVSSAELLASLTGVKAALDGQDNRAEIEVLSDGRVILTVDYEHVDYTEVEFRQIQPRDLIVEFVPLDGDGLLVRSTKNPFADTVVDEIFAAIKTHAAKDLVRKSISLEGYVDPVVRTQFFEAVMHGLAQHSFVTVTEAYCYKPKVAENIAEDEDDEEGSPPDVEKLPYVERVSLKGDGVNRSFVIDGLYEKGYYIVKVVWRVRPKRSLDDDAFELEAQFSDPSSCTGFSYQVRCAYLNEEGNITDKKRQPTPKEEDLLFRSIEQAAKLASDSLGE